MLTLLFAILVKGGKIKKVEGDEIYEKQNGSDCSKKIVVSWLKYKFKKNKDF